MLSKNFADWIAARAQPRLMYGIAKFVI